MRDIFTEKRKRKYESFFRGAILLILAAMIFLTIERENLENRKVKENVEMQEVQIQQANER